MFNIQIYLLISKKYSYTEVKNALHENTYKIFSNFEAVADFTELNPMEQELWCSWSYNN